MREKTIMLVEDNPDDVILTQRAFKKCRIAGRIVVAHDGIEALDYLLAKNKETGRYQSMLPAVILLDIKMPHMNGIETLKQIRSHSRTAYLPVVVLTSSDEEEDKLQSYQMGANSYIRKPIDFDRFLEISHYLGLYWLSINELPEQLEAK